MSALDEVIAQLQSNIQAAEQTASGVEGSKSKAGEVQQQAAMLGAERMTAGAGQLHRTIEEAQQLFEPAKAKLNEAVQQANALKT